MWRALNGHNGFTVGTFEDLRPEGIAPSEGIAIRFWCDDGDSNGNEDPLLLDGTIHDDSQYEYWYALIDEEAYRHASGELKKH